MPVTSEAEWKSNYAKQRDVAIKNWNARRNAMKKNYGDSHTRLAGVLGVTPGNAMTNKFNRKIDAAQYNYGDENSYIQGIKKRIAENE